MTTLSFEWRGLKCDAEVIIEPFVEGKFLGDPDDCWPDYGGDWDLEEFQIEGKDAMLLMELDDVCKEIESLINEMVDNLAPDEF